MAKKIKKIKFSIPKIKSSKQELDFFYKKIAKSGPMKSKLQQKRNKKEIKKIILESQDF